MRLVPCPYPRFSLATPIDPRDRHVGGRALGSAADRRALAGAYLDETNVSTDETI